MFAEKWYISYHDHLLDNKNSTQNVIMIRKGGGVDISHAILQDSFANHRVVKYTWTSMGQILFQVVYKEINLTSWNFV